MIKYGEYNITPQWPNDAYAISHEEYDGPEDRRSGHFFAKTDIEIEDEVIYSVQEFEDEEVVTCLKGDCSDEELKIQAVRQEYELEFNGEPAYIDTDVAKMLSKAYDAPMYRIRALKRENDTLCKTLSKKF